MGPLDDHDHPPGAFVLLGSQQVGSLGHELSLQIVGLSPEGGLGHAEA
jgi:hypothetical protein